MNEHFARTFSRMMWVTFIVGGLIATYYFMPEPVQRFIMQKIEWLVKQFGIKL